MQTPINSRDLALQNTIPRVLPISINYINLSCPTQQFKYGTDNVAQPASTIVTATLIGILQGTVNFTTTGLDPAPTAVGNTLTINPDHMTGDVVTINASMPAQGTLYQAVPLTLSKIYNQLVAKTTRTVDLLPAYTDGSGYALPAADNSIELYNGVVKLTSDVAYGPATQTKNGLTATVNVTNGLITLSQASTNAWTSTSESFTFTATRGAIAYTTTYTITKAKQGVGGQQLIEPALYQWSTAQPAAPTGTSQYTWTTQAHVYTPTTVNPDTWSIIVPQNPGGTVKLWKVTKAVTAEASLTTTTTSFTWTSSTIRQITTEANELIKTASPKIYAVALNVVSLPALVGTSDYNWATKTIQAIAPVNGQVQPTIPSGWSTTEPTLTPGFTVYQAAVDIIDRQSATITSIDWSKSSVSAIKYAGGTGLSGITAILTNDTHAIPTDSTDSTRNLTNSGTDLFIYEGATPLVYDANYADTTGTGKFKVTAAVDGVEAGDPAVVTVVGTGTGVRFADLKSASFDKAGTGSITFTVTGRRLTVEPGQTLGTPFTYTVKQSFTKTPSGIQGVPGVAYWIASSASVIQRTTPVSGSPSFNPSSITFTAKKSTGGTPSDYTDGYVKLFRNGALVNPPANDAKITSFTYTIPADTTSIRYELYSDYSQQNGLSNLLDSETIPVVADGGKGDQGLTGISARRAYIVVPSAVTPATTPATYEPVPELGYPVNGTWFTTNSNSITWTVSWTASAPTSISEGFTLYQSDGLYNSATQKTTWNPPYISSLKVGNLAAISLNTGGLTISDFIKGGDAASLTEGAGFYVNSSGNLRVGTPGAAQLKFDSGVLSISNSSGTNIFTVINDSKINSDAAILKATTALQTGGSVTWLGDPSIEIVSSTQLKRIAYTGYTANTWDSQKYSAESYVNGAYISLQYSAGKYLMIGLTSDPEANANYNTIDYAWYFENTDTYIFENGTLKTNNLGTFNTNSVYTIVYDGAFVRYYIDGVIKREIAVAANLKLYVDSSFSQVGGEVKNIRFGPVGSKGDKGDKPVLGTDYFQPATFDITNTGVTFKKDAAGAVTPATATLTTAYANIAGTITHSWKKAGSNTVLATTSTYDVPKADFDSVTTNTYTCTITGTINGVANQTRSDSITIPLLQDGSSAIQVLNSNERITFTAPKSGYSGITFTGGTSTIIVYIGTTPLNYDTSGANTFNASISSTGISGLTTSNTTNTFNIFTTPGTAVMSAETATVVVTITVRDAANQVSTITSTINYSLSRKGEDGLPSTVPGPTGARGSLQGFGAKYLITSEAWSDYLANRIIKNIVDGEAYDSSLYTTTLNRPGDLVTITNAAKTNAFTKFWDGTNWIDPAVIINGNLIVTGTVGADKLAANSVLIGHEIRNSAGTFVMNFGSTPFISISV